MARDTMELLQGTLDVLVLRGIAVGGGGAPMHGYNLLGWLRRATDGALRIEDAALYPALHRLEARGLIASEWGLSENNRRAKYYALTPAGRRALRAESASWARYVAIMAKALDLETA